MKKIPILFKIPYSALKWAALFFMTYDHILKFLFLVDATNPVLIPGRFALPLFIFMITWNAAHKDVIIKYLKRLLPFAIISLVIDLAYYWVIPINILFTFFLALSMIGLFERISKIEDKNNRYIFYIYTAVIISVLGHFTEYRIGGIWVIFFMYKFFKTRSIAYYALCLAILPFAASSITSAIIVFIFASLLLLAEPIPSKKRSSFKKTGWMFYAYFPLHKLVLAIILRWMGII